MATKKFQLTDEEERKIEEIFDNADIEALLALDDVEVIRTKNIKPSLTPVRDWADPDNKEAE